MDDEMDDDELEAEMSGENQQGGQRSARAEDRRELRLLRPEAGRADVAGRGQPARQGLLRGHRAVGAQGLVDNLRYQQADSETTAPSSNEYAFMKIRYKLPDSDTSTLITAPVTVADEVKSVNAAPREARFAAAVAGFGQLLRGGQYTGDFSYDDVIALANASKGNDPFGYRSEFVNLVRLAKSAAALEPLK